MQFLPSHATRPYLAGLLVAEAHQEQSAARLQHMRQPVDVPAPRFIIDHMEKARVEHRREPLVPGFQCERVLGKELDRQTALAGLCPGTANRLVEVIDASHPMSAGGEKQSGLTCSA